MTFQKLGLFLFSGKETPILVYQLDGDIFGQHHRNNNFLRYAPETKSSPRVVTGKWILKN